MKSFTNLLLVALMPVLFFSCKKENNLGLPSDPEPGFELASEQGLEVKMISTKVDSARSDEPAIHLLGSLYDPYFGRSTAGFLTRFVLQNSNVNFGEGSHADSLVLSIAYAESPSVYGNADKLKGLQRIKVYETSRNLVYDSVYYSNFSPYPDMVPDALVADRFVYPEPEKSLTINGQNVGKVLRIPLSSALMQKIFDAGSGTSFIDDNAEFQTLLKGLMLISDGSFLKSGEGGIMYFNPASLQSKLTLYYTTAANESKSFDFNIVNSSARLNFFLHDRSGTELEKQFTGTAIDTSQVYLQSMAGTRVKIELPFLDKLKSNDRISVNQCAIQFQVDPATASAEFPLFAQLYLTGIDSSGNGYILDDQAGGINYGGLFKASDYTYTFDISRYAQQVITGNKPNLGLYLIGGGTSATANRVVLKGAKNVKINFKYTKF